MQACMHGGVCLVNRDGDSTFDQGDPKNARAVGNAYYWENVFTQSPRCTHGVATPK